jgi:cysteine protease ATG4
MPVSSGGSELDPRELSTESTGDLDPVAEHYVTQYSASELRTFHCDRVRKIPLSGLDPSMLLGFLCKDEADWIDFRNRVNEVGHSKHRCVLLVLILLFISPWNGFVVDAQAQDYIYNPRRATFVAV